MEILKKSWTLLTIVSLMTFGALAFGPMAGAESGQRSQVERGLLLPNEHVVLGIVQQVKSDVIQVNIGQLEPLFLSLRTAAENGMTTIELGDELKIVVNDQNQIIDFHKANDPGWDRALKGHLLQPLMGDHRWAVIQTEKGANETYEVKEEARHTLMNIPVGVPAVFLLRKDNILIDATFGDEGALLDTLAQWSKKRQRVVHF